METRQQTGMDGQHFQVIKVSSQYDRTISTLQVPLLVAWVTADLTAVSI